MALFSWLYSLLLFFLVHSPLNSSSSLPSTFPPYSPLCHPHESSALHHFKNSFSTSIDSFCANYRGIANPNSTVSWDMSRDCCTWSGVTCDHVTGHVIRLDLACSGLEGILHSNNSLFSLGHLQSLILSNNHFYGYELPSQFGRFSNLIHLDLSEANFTGQIPLELSYLSKLVTLDLSGNSYLEPETPSLKRIIANLTNLRELFLSEVNMSHVLPNSFMNLSTSLTSLDLSYSELKGEFPENVFNLPNLQVLDLSYNTNLSGSFPRYNWSSPLKVLNLSWSGIMIDFPYLTRKLKYINVLSLQACNLIGTSPNKLLGNFTQITSLDLSLNNLGGQIPWSSFLNLKLNDLDLSENNFMGHIPEICSNSTEISSTCVSSKNQSVGPLPRNLKSLILYSNELSGTIPSWLYSLPSLQHLDLGSNQFIGSIHEFQYNSLEYLDLRNNKLQGLFPRSIFEQVNLSYLYLSSNNLSGVVQFDQFSKLKNLTVLDLSYNSLSLHSINNTDSTLPKTLSTLYLSSCGISEFPYSLRSAENLGSLDLSNNQIEGSVPQWLWNVGKDSLYVLNISYNFLTHVDQIPWKNLEFIDLSSNQIQGHLPILPPLTLSFSISNNKLAGKVPSLICNISSLEVLDLSNNNLSGDIPPCIGNSISYLSVLNLRMNKLHGIIPPSFSKGNFLTYLNLHGNQLEGSLPKSLLNCKQLQILDVGNNKINGSFPHWLESLPELQVLILRTNRFHGPISKPKVRSPFQKLRIMDISNNEFMGPLPAKYFESFLGMMDAHSNYLEYMELLYGPFINYGNTVMVAIKGFYLELEKIQTMFIAIDFSRNNFTGEIPKLIGKLNSLKGLNFSHNKLTGNIPASLGNLSNLEWLDLSSNEFVGKIPWQLAGNLNQLGFLNLSMNKLEGPIPRGPQFNTFKDDSYKGNLGLCGFPVSKSCSEDPTHQSSSPTFQEEGNEEHMHGFDWKVVLMGYGSGMVIGISVGYMVLKDRTIDWLVENLREQWGPQVKRSKKKARQNGRIREETSNMVFLVFFLSNMVWAYLSTGFLQCCLC